MRAIVTAPKQAKKGELIELKALVGHKMETGYRHDEQGRAVPRDILTRFSCSYNGVEVFRADLQPAIAANPYLSFQTRATESGTLVFSWSGDGGASHTETLSLVVE